MIVVAGEALIDLAPRDGLLAPLPGGSPYNVAVGLGRLGRPVAFLGRLSTDGFGQRLADRLAKEGVDLGLVAHTAAPTTLAVVHLDDARVASYGFYLDGTSAAGLSADDVPALPDGAALHVSLGAVTLDTVPAGRAVQQLIAGAAGRHTVVVDPNIRPSVIDDLPGYAGRLGQVLAGVDVVKASDEDLAALGAEGDGAGDALDLARSWARSGPALVVVTRGPDGALALRPDAPEVAVPGLAVEVVDTVGAGDAFTAGLLAWLDANGLLGRDALQALSNQQLTAALEHAVKVAAITCTRAGADPPRASEL